MAQDVDIHLVTMESQANRIEFRRWIQEFNRARSAHRRNVASEIGRWIASYPYLRTEISASLAISLRHYGVSI